MLVNNLSVLFFSGTFWSMLPHYKCPAAGHFHTAVSFALSKFLMRVDRNWAAAEEFYISENKGSELLASFCLSNIV